MKPGVRRDMIVLILALSVIGLLVFSPNALDVAAAWWAAMVMAVVAISTLLFLAIKGKKRRSL